ncbi:MAG: cation transporter [Oscillospiraceae bacterium]|nr:cation transporter [Oscillospiraceae bacterium]
MKEKLASYRTPEERSRALSRTSWATVLINLALAAGKLAAGIVSKSGAMVSDAVHSASDVFSTFIVLIGVRISGREADRDHPYGHERFESMAAIILSAVLMVTGLLIGWEGVSKLMHPEGLERPGLPALIAAAVSIAVKEAMFHWTRAVAKRAGSDALMADAWHHRSDALSSVGALIGIGGARLGFAVLDPLAGVVISIFIAKAALEIFRDAADKLIDRRCDDATEERIRSLALSQEGVRGVDLLMTRQFGSRIYVELEISADGALPLEAAHAIAHRVHDAVESALPQVKHVTVHVNPAEE